MVSAASRVVGARRLRGAFAQFLGYRGTVGRTATYLTELGVGIACLVGAVGLRRDRPAIALVLGIAGIAAAGHAAWRLLG
jgi:hypothetical protein